MLWTSPLARERPLDRVPPNEPGRRTAWSISNEHGLLRLRTCRPEAQRLGYGVRAAPSNLGAVRPRHRAQAGAMPRPGVEGSRPSLCEEELGRGLLHRVRYGASGELDQGPEIERAAELQSLVLRDRSTVVRHE